MKIIDVITFRLLLIFPENLQPYIARHCGIKLPARH